MYKNIGFCTFVQAHPTYSIYIEQMICFYSLTHRQSAGGFCPRCKEP